MRVLEKEIEFYKEISGRLTTAFFISIGGTVATLKQSGWEMWAFIGAITSIILAVVLFLNMKKWKRKIQELVEHDDSNN
jgi:lysylphosphatidylglycerol synthetase-like protein (DUF2156 family)